MRVLARASGPGTGPGASSSPVPRPLAGTAAVDWTRTGPSVLRKPRSRSSRRGDARSGAGYYADRPPADPRGSRYAPAGLLDQQRCQRSHSASSPSRSDGTARRSPSRSDNPLPTRPSRSDASARSGSSRSDGREWSSSLRSNGSGRSGSSHSDGSAPRPVALQRASESAGAGGCDRKAEEGCVAEPRTPTTTPRARPPAPADHMPVSRPE